MPADKTISRSIKLPSIKLSEEDFEDLFILLSLNDSDFEGHTIQRLPNVHIYSGDVSYSFKETEPVVKFLKKKNASSISFNNSVYANGVSHSVSLSMNPRSVSCSIDGNDEVWVYGKLEQIKSFIDQRRSENHRIRRILHFSMVFFWILLVINSIVFASGLLSERARTHIQIEFLWFSAFTTAFTFVAFSLSFLENKLFPMFILRNTSTSISLRSIVFWLFGIMASVATIIGVVFQIMGAFPES